MMWLLKILKIYLEERDKPFNVAKTQNKMNVNIKLFQWSINVLIRSRSLTNHFWKSLYTCINQVEEPKMYSLVKYNTCSAHLAEMQLTNKYDKEIRFLSLIFLVNLHGWFL